VTGGTVRLRPAAPEDVEAITALVESNSRRGHLLPRSIESIRGSLPDWVVAENGRGIVGCASLLPYASDLGEVRSLAVADPEQGRGLGLRLIEAIVAEARRRGVGTVFALTRSVGLFEKAGFEASGKEMFPEKVWRDCDQCLLRDNCDEIAMVLRLHPAVPATEGMAREQPERT
jgi:amino-acid N-acetyltransferase